MLVARKAVFHLVSVALLLLGFAQFSVAGVVSSGDVVHAQMRGERIAKIEALLAEAEVAEQLTELGVSTELVLSRVQNMTDAELLDLANGIDEQIAGADIVGTVGVVFIVLIILELVGVTDIFKSF